MIAGGMPILTAAEMRALEAGAVEAGGNYADLMDKAGAAVAWLAARLAAGRPIVVVAGPGNNGGDGYVAARHLREAGAQVRVVALAPPVSDLAQLNARRWGNVDDHVAGDASHNAIVVDAAFGTGVTRPLDSATQSALARITARASRVLAVDLPSGVNADTGEAEGAVRADVTLALAALKPAHMLQPAASICGIVKVADIGLRADSQLRAAHSIEDREPAANAHKYSRGLVVVVAGAMPGAAELAARAALRGGAGYVRLLGSGLPPAPPYAIVRAAKFSPEVLADERIGAIVIGPGLGSGDVATARLAAVEASGLTVVADADAVAWAAAQPGRAAILTPHAGEFANAFPDLADLDKVTAARAAAERSDAVVIYKGADTVIAAPDGRAAIASQGCGWLATAGTGDVLAGLCGAALAAGLPPFEAAQAAVLRHHRLARQAGAHLIADDLVR